MLMQSLPKLCHRLGECLSSQVLDMLGGGVRSQYRINRAASWSSAAASGQRRPEALAQPANPAHASGVTGSNSRWSWTPNTHCMHSIYRPWLGESLDVSACVSCLALDTGLYSLSKGHHRRVWSCMSTALIVYGSAQAQQVIGG